MNPSAFKVGRFRFQAALRGRWTSYLALVLFIAILGGVAIGTVAGARRTETSFTTLLNSRDTTQIYGAIQVYNPQAGYSTGYSASAVKQVRQLPHVAGVESEVGIDAFPLGPRGQVIPGDSGFSPTGSVNGLELKEDRLIITMGRLPNPHRPDEFVADSGTVRQFGWHLGETVTFGYYTNKASVAAGLGHPKLSGQFRARFVGTGAIEAESLVQDQVDNVNNSLVLFTPALTQRFLSCCANDTFVGIKLKDGNRYDAQVQKEYEELFPKIGVPPQTELNVEKRVDDSITPEALAFGIFRVTHRPRRTGDRRTTDRANGPAHRYGFPDSSSDGCRSEDDIRRRTHRCRHLDRHRIHSRRRRRVRHFAPGANWTDPSVSWGHISTQTGRYWAGDSPSSLSPSA